MSENVVASLPSHCVTRTCGFDQDIVRSIIDDIVVEVLNNTERLSVTVHWAGGFESQHETRRHVQAFDQLDAAKELAHRIQRTNHRLRLQFAQEQLQFDREFLLRSAGDRA